MFTWLWVVGAGYGWGGPSYLKEGYVCSYLMLLQPNYANFPKKNLYVKLQIFQFCEKVCRGSEFSFHIVLLNTHSISYVFNVRIRSNFCGITKMKFGLTALQEITLDRFDQCGIGRKRNRKIQIASGMSLVPICIFTTFQ